MGAEKEKFGAPEASELEPLGGGVGYKRIVVESDFTVSSAEELREALSKAVDGQCVYLDDGAELDMTVWVKALGHVIDIPDGVILASGRGLNGSFGGLIYSDEFATRPLIQAGSGVRITGLRLKGPDQKVRYHELIDVLHEMGNENPEGPGYYSFPTSDGIQCDAADLVVDNCEILGWGHGGITLSKNAESAHIHHNHIHHCQRAGLGYGVVMTGADVLIEYNSFDYTRHAIAGTGTPGTAYEARFNHHGPHSTSHCFDMHGSMEANVSVDGKSIAGERINIHHNTFMAPEPAVAVRAVPRESCDIHHNWFMGERETAVRLYGEEATGNPAAFGMVDNVWGQNKEPWEYTSPTA